MMGRGMRLVWAGIVCGALLVAPARAQDVAIAFTPASGWVLDYADDSCALRRNFVAGERNVYLEMRQHSPFTQLQITVASADLDVTEDDPRFRFGSDGPFTVYDLAAYGRYGEGVMGVSFFGSVVEAGVRAEGEVPTTDQFSAQLDQMEAGVSGLQVENVFDEPVLLQTGPLGPPMQALRACMTDLVASWGVETFFSDPGVKAAEAINFERWARQIQSRFPRALLGRKDPAHVLMRLLIDSEGTATACRIQQPVVGEDYQETICGIVMNLARHHPARDSAGNPIASYRIVSIVYSSH